MKKISLIILASFAAAASQAATLSLNFYAGNKITGNDGVLANPMGIVATLVLTDTVTGVSGLLTHLPNTSTSQKIDYVKLFAFNYPTGNRTVTSSSSSFDDKKSEWGNTNDASRQYNLTVQFLSNNANKVAPGDSVLFNLTGTGLDVSDFVGPDGDPFAMLHVQGIGNNGNGSVKLDAVPEPASMAALGFGAVAMLRRRKKA